jgi:hypothetical protein
MSVFEGQHADLTEKIIGALFTLLNFGPKAEFKRKVYDNERKGALTWINGGPG